MDAHGVFFNNNVAVLRNTSHEEVETCGHYSSDLLTRISIQLWLIFIIIGILFGNSLVIMSIVIVRRLWTPPNILLVSLAVSDWLVGAVVVPLSLLTEQGQIIGHACNVIFFLQNFLCSSSICNLTAIAVDRYMILTRPFQYAHKRTRGRIAVTIILVWLLSCSATIPPVFARKFFHGDDEREKLLRWGDVIFELSVCLITFFLPLFVMLILYGRIFILARALANKAFKNRQNITLVTNTLTTTTSTTNNSKPRAPVSAPTRRKSKLEYVAGSIRGRSNSIKRLMEVDFKAVRTLGVIMGAFTMCWLPYYMIQMLKPIYRMFSSRLVVNDAILEALQWLGYFNSLLNPFIYSILNRDLRRPLLHLLRCHCTSLNQHMRDITREKEYGAQQSSFRRQLSNNDEYHVDFN